MDFRDALNIVIAELTPQPWDYTGPDGTTLRVIPAGLTADRGCAEVMIRITRADASGLAEFGITRPDTKGVAEVGITATDLPALIGALETYAGWEHFAGWGDPTRIMLTAALDLTVTEGHPVGGVWVEVTESVRLPEQQRLPLASALRRALDVAHGWES